MLADHEVVKRMTIDEKIGFWRWVMQQAADRGIQVYFFTWNVFTFGAAGKHGITDDLNNPTTKKYFRASVRETINYINRRMNDRAYLHQIIVGRCPLPFAYQFSPVISRFMENLLFQMVHMFHVAGRCPSCGAPVGPKAWQTFGSTG